jgi:haloalkane dehalogenase
MSSAAATRLSSIDVDGVQIAYRRLGQGPPVLLLHGWPTSSYLWRNLIPPVAAVGRDVVAPDLPGFGASAKPPDAPYTLDYQARMLDRFLAAVRLDRVALVVHDLGGPVGLLWAVRHPERLERLVLLDTLLYPRKLYAMRTLLALLHLPALGLAAVRPAGLKLILRLGVADRGSLSDETRASYALPFVTREDQQTLLRTLLQPRFSEFDEIRAGMHRLRETPTLIAWADHDLLLPRSEMRRIARLLAGAEQTTITHAGHFLQEDQPQQLIDALSRFLAEPPPSPENPRRAPGS